jgi:hypothetical protein
MKLAPLLLKIYPPQFRARYGNELEALAEDTGLRPRVVFDLVRGAARQWMVPTLPGSGEEAQRARMLATVTTAFVCWAVSIVAAVSFGRRFNDPPVVALNDDAQVYFDISSHLAEGIAVAGLVVGLVYWLRIVIPAIRAKRHAVWAAAIAPAGITGLWAGVTFLLSLLWRTVQPSDLPWLPIVFGGYVTFTLACVAGCIVAVCRVIRSSNLTRSQLRLGIAASLLGAVALAVESVATLICGILVVTHQNVGAQGATQILLSVALLVATWIAVTVSSIRGFRAWV